MSISVIVPIFNEEENIKTLYQELVDSLKDLDQEFELIFIDDGSTDQSFEILSRLYKNDSRIVVIGFRRNFGQTAALSAGFDHAKGDIIITLDGDDLRRLEHVFDLDELMKKLAFFNIDPSQPDLAGRFILPPILTNKGLTYIGLNKDSSGKCVFLDESNACEIYTHRPRVCRTFPFSFNVKDGWLYWGASPFVDRCPGVGKGKRVTKSE